MYAHVYFCVLCCTDFRTQNSIVAVLSCMLNLIVVLISADTILFIYQILAPNHRNELNDYSECCDEHQSSKVVPEVVYTAFPASIPAIEHKHSDASPPADSHLEAEHCFLPGFWHHALRGTMDS